MSNYSQFTTGLPKNTKYLGMPSNLPEEFYKYKRKFDLYYRYDAFNNYWVHVASPISIDFEVSRNNLATANTCKLTLYNLSKQTRDLFFRDQLDIGKPYDPKDVGYTSYTRDSKKGYETLQKQKEALDKKADNDITQYRNYFELWVGYESTNTSYLLFSGCTLYAYSYKQNVDYLTEISGYTVNMKDPMTYINYTAKAGTTKGQAIRNIVNQLTGVTEIQIDETIEKYIFDKDTVLMGTAEDILCDMFGEKPYIDNNAFVMFKDDSVIKRDPLTITEASGLLGSPKRTQNGVKITMAFEPSLRVGQLVQLGASRETTYNGTNFVVSGFRHTGSISPVKDSRTVTEVELLKGDGGYFRTAKVIPVAEDAPINVVIEEDPKKGTQALPTNVIKNI